MVVSYLLLAGSCALLLWTRQITVADLAVYPVLQWITMSIVDASILSPYPLLSAVMQRIRSHPKVAEYLVMDQEGKHGQ